MPYQLGYHAAYLNFAPRGEDAPIPTPLVHTVYTGVKAQSMTAAKDNWTHDVACPVCMNASAQFKHDRYGPPSLERFQPCQSCCQKGWDIVRIHPWVQTIMRFLGLLSDKEDSKSG